MEDRNEIWQQTSNSYLYGQDSIEMASESVDDDDEDQDEKDIYDQSNLTQRILEAEKRYSTSSIHTSYFSSEYFEKPALYRVLFMGAATEEERKTVFKKLSQGFVQVLHYRQHLLKIRADSAEDLSLLDPPVIPFKEIKHNVLLLSDDAEQDLISDVYEDIGVSMIEADFTWSSNAINYAEDPAKLLLQYAWKQCPNPRELPTAWLEDELTQTEFKGHMHSDRTPNGIDLCVYFYKEPDARVQNDMLLLCTLRKFGIYVLPLTTTRNESLKSQFADMLTLHKVRCLDLGNLDVGQQPSFFYQPTPMLDRISRLQDMECTQANLPRVATYQILAIDQFCVIKDHAIFQLLKRTRERQAIREEMKERYFTEKKEWVTSEEDDETDSQVYSYDHLVTSNTPTQQTFVEKKWQIDYRQFFRAVFVLILSVLSVRFLVNHYRHQWTAEFKVSPDFSFTLMTRDARGQLAWDHVVPQVWLNHKVYIPLKKIDYQPGMYKLNFDVLELKNPISFEFSVNTTTQISYYTKPMQYLFIHHSPQDTSYPSHRQHAPHYEQQKVRESSYTFKKAWDTMLFFLNNDNIFRFLIVE